ncbi:hypothetical protein EV356DRAFT_572895 [Viridothelium virens]|uniref:DUF92-domain-containing protein n=1 Tax=Viridothelium virens TaxID=1048519 RepID=A0A6A6HLX4_VIRVR|nr:hypothetical protein EV356DRAFT_572895 [Viridothelium virens]
MQPLIAISAIVALLYRAYSRRSLTPLGLVVAGITATIHAIHPWSVFFTLLGVFFLAGSAVTKVKHDVKARLTLSASGTSGGEGPRTHIQVLANSLVASTLIILHARKLAAEPAQSACWPKRSDVLVVGIIANYAAVAADTFSSELGILSPTPPRLLTSLGPPLRPVPRGTNGGVTPTGLLAGLLGAALIAATAVLLTPFCGGEWSIADKAAFAGAVVAVGVMGSLLDSVMGGVLQASVVDVRSGKVVEGEGGRKVLVGGGEGREKGRSSRKVESGWDVLSNNGVNLLMAASMSGGAMVATCWFWGLPLSGVLW